MLENLYSFILGYMTAKVFSGAREHTRGVFKSLILSFHNLKIHLHHWIMGFLFVGIYVLLKTIIMNEDLTGFDFLAIYFLIGIIVQGIVDYRDWKEIVVK